MANYRVLHVTFDMAIGGTEKVISQLVLNGNGQAFEPIILCIDGCVGALGEELERQHVRVVSFTRKPGFDIQLAQKIRKFVLDERIDVLHCHQYTPYIYGLLASLMTPAKVVFTEHGRFYPDFIKWKRFLVNPLLSLITSNIVSISKATRQALVRYENFPARNIEVIYNGLQHKNYSNNVADKNALQSMLGIENDELVFATISRLDPIKNQTMMIKAFASLKRAGIRAKLIIVGDGPERKTLEQVAEAEGVVESVVFTGFQIEPQPYFDLLDVFLLSSFSEGTSMTILEAMAFAKPCIVTDAGGNAELVDHGISGLVVPNDDQDGFFHAMKALAEDHSLRDAFGQAGQRRFRKDFTVDKMCERYESLYRKLLS